MSATTLTDNHNDSLDSIGTSENYSSISSEEEEEEEEDDGDDTDISEESSSISSEIEPVSVQLVLQITEPDKDGGNATISINSAKSTPCLSRANSVKSNLAGSSSYSRHNNNNNNTLNPNSKLRDSWIKSSSESLFNKDETLPFDEASEEDQGSSMDTIITNQNVSLSSRILEHINEQTLEIPSPPLSLLKDPETETLLSGLKKSSEETLNHVEKLYSESKKFNNYLTQKLEECSSVSPRSSSIAQNRDDSEISPKIVKTILRLAFYGLLISGCVYVARKHKLEVINTINKYQIKNIDWGPVNQLCSQIVTVMSTKEFSWTAFEK